MKIKDLSKEELENMSYDDLAYLILKEFGNKMKINDLFKEVCKLLNLSDEVFENHIADFFELLSTEKRFLMLENGYWDLRDNHSQKVVIDEDDEEEIFIDVPADVEEEKEEDDIFEETDETDDIIEDDLKDFAVISEDDEENENIN